MLERLKARAEARADAKREAAIRRIIPKAPRWLHAEAVREGVRIKARRLRWWLVTHPWLWGFWR